MINSSFFRESQACNVQESEKPSMLRERAALHRWYKSFLVFLVCFFVACLAVNAQVMRSADVKTNFRSELGFGVGLTMNLVDKLDFAPSFNYYFQDSPNYWSVDGDLHYNFQVAPRWEVFPLAGVTMLYDRQNTTHDGGLKKKLDSHLRFGADFGCGCAFEIDNDWTVKGELKYQAVKRHDDLFATVGLSYKF